MDERLPLVRLSENQGGVTRALCPVRFPLSASKDVHYIIASGQEGNSATMVAGSHIER